MLFGTTALAPTVAPRLITAWWSTTLPEPASDSSSRVHPSRCVRWPMTQPSPMMRGEARAGVDHRPVLDRRGRPDGDGAVVAAQDGLGPHARLGADRDVTDDDRVGVDVGLADRCAASTPSSS